MLSEAAVASFDGLVVVEWPNGLVAEIGGPERVSSVGRG